VIRALAALAVVAISEHRGSALFGIPRDPDGVLVRRR
jgi:hypothetical protein